MESDGRQPEMGGRAAVRISELARHEGQSVQVQGWLYNKRSSGKILFLIVRDGSGQLQCVGSLADLGEAAFAAAAALSQEAAVAVRGVVRADRRAPGGWEMTLAAVELIADAEEYPITHKEHGVDFLMDHRHLWLRTPRQAAILRIRAEIERGFQDYLDRNGFTRVDGPVLTPNAVEGTTTLFETDYFGEHAYLTQSSQLYAEAAAMALGRVYAFGPAFRAEKSKTRRHLIEFWMLEPEMAYVEHEGNLAVQEALLEDVVQRVLANCAADLATLNRDTARLAQVRAPFARITYAEAVRIVNQRGLSLEWGEDFGAPHETAIADAFERPVFVERYPAAIKPFYMQPDPADPRLALCADLLAPEGYGEIIGGSERIHDLDLLRARLEEHRLPTDIFDWYLDLRRYGSVPHSGFGLGLERTVAWICGLEHVRETIPFPRLLNRMRP